MDTHFIETPGRVLRLTVEPGSATPGHCRRTLTLSVERGAPLEFADRAALDRWLAACIAELVSGGVDVVGWEVVTD